MPTFVLEFLLARYCASDDPAEIQAGMEAVLATLQENYVRPAASWLCGILKDGTPLRMTTVPMLPLRRFNAG